MSLQLGGLARCQQLFTVKSGLVSKRIHVPVLRAHQNLTFINKNLSLLTERQYMNVSMAYRLATFVLSKIV